jgi:hypothetical protein
MKYRHQANTKIQYIENDLKILRTIVQRQEPLKTYIEVLDRVEERLEDLRGVISIEPITSNEVAD